MTNRKPRQFERELDQDNEHERRLPCRVGHPDAGGRCGRAATIGLYGMLNFCEEHGEEAKVGALLEAHQDAFYFFDRLCNPHTPALSAIVERELGAALDRLGSGNPGDDEHQRALVRAYPNPPEYVREQVASWEAEESANAARGDSGPTPLDTLLDSYYTICKLMRVAFEERHADYLIEMLDHERQSAAAQAAFALRFGVDTPRPAPLG